MENINCRFTNPPFPFYRDLGVADGLSVPPQREHGRFRGEVPEPTILHTL